jgi:hypothetical protein
MPSWKKVIISGSNAALNSLTVTNGITGSLFGTASFATTAATASNSQNAQDILIYVKNTSGAQINKGKVVRISGATGDNALIATASYESDGLSANTLGITNQDIPNDSFGYVMTEGTLIGINTDTFSAGQLLYLGATGSIIGTAPIAPLHAVRLGQVLRVQTNNGSIYVRIDNGYELGELHDVVDTTTTSSFGDLLVKSGSVWINSKQLSGSYGITGSINMTGGGVTGSLFGTASFAVSSSFATNAATASIVSSIAGNITNNVDNYLLTATGGGNINGEQYLTFNGSTLLLTLTGSFAHGNQNQALGGYSHAEGFGSIALGPSSHAEGGFTKTIGNYSHTEGTGTSAGNEFAFRAGEDASISSGVITIDSGYGNISSIFGAGNLLLFSDLDDDNLYGTVIFIINSVSWNGTNTIVTLTDTSVNTSYANCGDLTYITSWAGQGGDRLVYADYSHAEGNITNTFGNYSHAEGLGTIALGLGSHAEGYYTVAGGQYSHAAGNNTVALGNYQSVIGQYNISSSAPSIFILGNGTSNTSRSNLLFASGSQVQVTGSVIATQGFTGSLFGTASVSTTSIITTQDTTPVTYNVVFTGGTSGNQSLNVDATTLTYNPSTTTFTCPNLAGTASFVSSTSNAFIQNGNSFGTTALLGTNDNQSLALETNGTTRMFISSSGNIGVGNGFTSAAYPLHVSASVSNVSIYASNDIVAFSDQSVKENIRPIENVLERIGDSRGVLYDRIDNGEKDNIGFIAQELEVAFPELVVTNSDGTKAVKYQNAVAVLFEAIKEQQKQINGILKLLNK